MGLNVIGRELEAREHYIPAESLTAKTVTLEGRDKAIVFISFNSPYLAVGAAELKEYKELLVGAESDDSVAAVVLKDVSDNRKVSFAGANVKEFKDLTAKAVGGDKAKIGRIARKVKPKEDHFGLSYVPFCKMPICFFVNTSVEVKKLSIQ